MAAQWPLVAARLLALLPTLPGGWDQVSVHDGAARDSVKRVFCTVGHSTDGLNSTAGTFSTTQSPDGFLIQETGSVACQLTYTDDAPSLATARAAVFPLLDTLLAYVQADRRLGGVLSPEGTSDLTFDVNSAQPIPGAALTVTFALHYFTVT